MRMKRIRKRREGGWVRMGMRMRMRGMGGRVVTEAEITRWQFCNSPHSAAALLLWIYSSSHFSEQTLSHSATALLLGIKIAPCTSNKVEAIKQQYFAQATLFNATRINSVQGHCP